MSRDGKCVAIHFDPLLVSLKMIITGLILQLIHLKATSNLDQKFFHDIKGENIIFDPVTKYSL